MDDSKIIDLFFERSEIAIIELSNKYGSICMKVSMNVLNNPEDAEECVNDSYLGVWNAIPPHKPNPLLAFVCRIVRNISINLYKKTMPREEKEIMICVSKNSKTVFRLQIALKTIWQNRSYRPILMNSWILKQQLTV